MKRKGVTVLVTCCCIMALVGCGQTEGGKKASDTTQRPTTEVQEIQKKEELKLPKKEEKLRITETTENKVEVKKEENTEQKTEEIVEKKSIEGTISEKKDFMFVIEDSSKKAYAFAFKSKPDGYEKLNVKDNVVVEYTGELSETEAFKGEVISVKKKDK